MNIALLIIVVVAAGLAPIWRMHDRRGITALEYYQYARSQEYRDRHIPIEEAKDRARMAYIAVTAAS